MFAVATQRWKFRVVVTFEVEGKVSIDLGLLLDVWQAWRRDTLSDLDGKARRPD